MRGGGPKPRAAARCESVRVRGRFPGDAAVRDLIVRAGRIERMARAEGACDIGGPHAVIAPPLFDLQVNGAVGISLQRESLGVEDLVQLDAALARWGVARWIPTLITGPPEALEGACRAIALARRVPALRRAIPGIHLEGPWISPEDGPRGAHPRAHVRAPDLRLFQRLYRAAEGAIAYTTVSPEWPETPRFIRALRQRGVLVSLGHHAAGAAQIHAAAEAGARLCTHLGNGLAQTMHRHDNPLWPQLAEPRLAASFIADGHHLPPDALRAMLRAKGPERAILVSDAVEITGLPPGPYTLFGAEVELDAAGRIGLADTGLLAGSGRMLLHGVFHAAQHGGLTLAEAFACATVNPARLLGLRAHGAPRAEAAARFLVADPSRPGDPPLAVFLAGQRVA